MRRRISPRAQAKQERVYENRRSRTRQLAAERKCARSAAGVARAVSDRLAERRVSLAARFYKNAWADEPRICRGASLDWRAPRDAQNKRRSAAHGFGSARRTAGGRRQALRFPIAETSMCFGAVGKGPRCGIRPKVHAPFVPRDSKRRSRKILVPVPPRSIRHSFRAAAGGPASPRAAEGCTRSERRADLRHRL